MYDTKPLPFLPFKTDTVLNDKTSDIDRDLWAFGSVRRRGGGGCHSSYLIALAELLSPSDILFSVIINYFNRKTHRK